MEEIESLIIEAEFREENRGRIKEWVLVNLDTRHQEHIGIRHGNTFRKEVELIDCFGEKGWVLGSAIKMPAESDFRTEIYKYYFWRPKQK